jgi:hypothetical protein
MLRGSSNMIGNSWDMETVSQDMVGNMLSEYVSILPIHINMLPRNINMLQRQGAS